MIVYPARDICPFVMYCVNVKPRSSLLIESTDSMIRRILHSSTISVGGKLAPCPGKNFKVVGRYVFGDELSECRWDVGLSVRCFRLRSSKIDVSTFEDRRSMCRVDLRESMIDMSTFEDG